MEIKTKDEDVIGTLLEGFDTKQLCNFLGTEWRVIGFDCDEKYHTFVLCQHKYKLSLRSY